jgi:hypothetical protein
MLFPSLKNKILYNALHLRSHDRLFQQQKNRTQIYITATVSNQAKDCTRYWMATYNSVTDLISLSPSGTTLFHTMKYLKYEYMSRKIHKCRFFSVHR